MDEDNFLADKPGDELLLVKGIGKTAAPALHQAGIHTLADLARQTDDSLTEILKGKVPPIVLQRIKRDHWADQAEAILHRMLIDNLASAGERSEEHNGNEEHAQPSLPVHSTWHEIADFFVSYGYFIDPNGVEHPQTKVHHSQADRMVHWEGIAARPLLDWMLNQAGLTQRREPEMEILHPADITPELQEQADASMNLDIQVEISDIWISEVAEPVLVQRSGEKGAEDRYLRVESQLHLSGPDAPELTSQGVPYLMEIHLVDQDTNAPRRVSTSAIRLVPGVLDYELQGDFEIPQLGKYQLNLIVHSESPGFPIAHARGPIIQVEA